MLRGRVVRAVAERAGQWARQQDRHQRQWRSLPRVPSRASSVFRQNVVTGEWVVYALGRSNRPRQLPAAPRGPPPLPAHEPTCPFCVGNEGMTPEPTYQRLGADGQWVLRVVPNKYPVVTQAVPADVEHSHTDKTSLFQEVPALGYHEVIIHARDHNSDMGGASPEETRLLAFAWRDRGRKFAKDPDVNYVTYFKNQGPISGASLAHPHAQLVALPVVPDSIWREQKHARDFFETHGTSAFDLMLGPDQACRIVEQTDLFTALVPFASQSPYEVWIVPRFSQAHYSAAADDEVEGFARILHRTVRRLNLVLDHPDYNIVVRTSPLPDRGIQRAFHQATFYRWHACVVPRLGAGAMAGFEIGSGIFSNSHLPENDAAELRDVTLCELETPGS